MKTMIIQTTCKSKKEARKIANILVKEKLCACVQLSQIESIYEWKNEVCNQKETLITIKTKNNNFGKIQSKIKELHSYDLPEIIGIKIDKISKDYKNFIKGNTK